MRRELTGHDELQHVEAVARAVLGIIDQRVEPGQVDHILAALHERVRRLWRDVQQEEDIQ